MVVRDTIGRAWEDEPISWEISPEAGRLPGDRVVVKRDGRPIPAQIAVRERHADGSVKTGVIRFRIDTLAKDATARITAEPGDEVLARPTSRSPGARGTSSWPTGGRP